MYTPSTALSWDNAGTIARDIEVLRATLLVDRIAARKLYREGAFCQSRAVVNVPIPVGTIVSAPNTQSIAGIVVETTDTTSQMQYLTRDDYLLCSVGGNPNPQLEFCLAPNGTLVDSTDSTNTFAYSNYAAAADTWNARSLFSLSANSNTTSAHATYFQRADYANAILQDAFNQRATELPLGNIDFQAMSTGATNKAIALGSVVLNVWQQIHTSLQLAIDNCATDPLPHWDDAYYFAQTTIADEYCGKFGTCNDNNMDTLWNDGKQALLETNCSGAQTIVDQIQLQLKIPLVQGLLWHAYELDIIDDGRDIVKAELMVLGAAVVPLVHACSPGHAASIAHNVAQGDDASSEVIASNLEATYACLGITCAQVGGIVDTANPQAYLVPPCGISTGGQSQAPLQSSDPSNNRPVVVGVTAALVVLLLAVIGGYCYCRRRRTKDPKDHTATPEVTSPSVSVEELSDAELI